MSPLDIPGFEAAVADLTARVGAGVPEVQAIIDEGRRTGMTSHEVMQKLVELLTSDPTIGDRITAIAAVTGVPDALVVPARAAFLQGDGVVVPPPPGGTGLPRLDPLYEAYLQERVQFDGDAPELRTGGLPVGATPAVPVDTTARNPVAVGWMLEQAQEEVARESKQIEQGRVDEVQALLTQEDTALVPSGPALLAKLDRDTLADPVGYERGQVPALREVETPTGWGLLSLTPEQQHQLAWKTISTTQGRRSVTRAIRDLVAGGLRNDGHDVEVHDGEPLRATPADVVAYVEWSVDLSGPGSTQPSFSFVDTAARAIVRKIGVSLGDEVVTGVVLDVVPVNTVDVRKVGWAARLLRREAVS